WCSESLSGFRRDITWRPTRPRIALMQRTGRIKIEWTQPSSRFTQEVARLAIQPGPSGQMNLRHRPRHLRAVAQQSSPRDLFPANDHLVKVFPFYLFHDQVEAVIRAESCQDSRQSFDLPGVGFKKARFGPDPPKPIPAQQISVAVSPAFFQ